MVKITAPGLVIREQNIGEADKLITVLTAKHGLVRAFSRGAKKTKSKKLAATSLLSYADFTFTKTRDAFSVEEALIKEVFFELRNDVQKMALAQYFCELAYEFCEEDFESEEILRLFLNALWLLKEDKKTPSFIKAVTELRLMSLSGYMPDLVACEKCGEGLLILQRRHRGHLRHTLRCHRRHFVHYLVCRGYSLGFLGRFGFVRRHICHYRRRKSGV